MSIINGDLSQSIPIYVTRKTADGLVASWSMSAWMVLLAQTLVWANIILWSLFGIVAVFWLSITAVF